MGLANSVRVTFTSQIQQTGGSRLAELAYDKEMVKNEISRCLDNATQRINQLATVIAADVNGSCVRRIFTSTPSREFAKTEIECTQRAIRNLKTCLDNGLDSGLDSGLDKLDVVGIQFQEVLNSVNDLMGAVDDAYPTKAQDHFSLLFKIILLSLAVALVTVAVILHPPVLLYGGLLAVGSGTGLPFLMSFINHDQIKIANVSEYLSHLRGTVTSLQGLQEVAKSDPSCTDDLRRMLGVQLRAILRPSTPADEVSRRLAVEGFLRDEMAGVKIPVSNASINNYEEVIALSNEMITEYRRGGSQALYAFVREKQQSCEENENRLEIIYSAILAFVKELMEKGVGSIDTLGDGPAGQQRIEVRKEVKITEMTRYVKDIGIKAVGDWKGDRFKKDLKKIMNELKIERDICIEIVGRGKSDWKRNTFKVRGDINALPNDAVRSMLKDGKHPEQK